MIYSEFGFGKHAGKTPDQVPVDYLRWVLGNVDDLDPDLETAIRASLRKRGGGIGGHSRQSDSSRQSAGGSQSGNPYTRPSAALPVAVDPALVAEIIREGRRSLAMRYHPDRGGDAEKMTRINASANFLEKKLTSLLGLGGAF